MNFLVLISVISSLLSTTIIPVGTKSINNNARCSYYNSGWIYLNNTKQIIADLTNNNQTEECEKSQPCGSIIISQPINLKDFYSRHHRIPRRILVTLKCMTSRQCSFTQNSLYQDHTDYDIPHKAQTTECCQGNLCNTLDKLPNTNKFLNSPARTMEAHNEHCPNYSTNYQVIWLDSYEKTNQEVTIESGSNLLLSSHFIDRIVMREFKTYKGTSWLVTRTNDPSSNYVPIIKFSKTGDDDYDESSQDYIAKDKIFFVTADVMHICNFTDAEGNLTIKHVDIVDDLNLPELVKLVNIIVKSSATSPTTESIIPTTPPTTTNEQTDYSTTAKNTEFYKTLKRINNNTRCYHYKSGWIHLNNTKQIIADLTNNNQTEKCEKSHICGLSIVSKPINHKDNFPRKHRIPKHLSLRSECISNTRCSSFTQASLYRDHTDYDVPHRTSTVECCQGNLCNTLDNLPITNEFLNSPARSIDAHNEKCPNYSNNYQVIWLDSHHKPKQDFIIESGSDLLLSFYLYWEKFSNRRKQTYNGTSWLVARTDDSNSNYIPIVQFSKNSYMSYDKRSQDYIAKDKIFFITADTMHICNFTDAEGNLTIKHIDVFDDTYSSKLVNIIVKFSATSPKTEGIIPTTTQATTNKQTDYSTTVKNTVFHTMSKSIASTINNTYSGNKKTNLFKDLETADNSWKLPVIIIVPTLTAVTIIAIAIYKKHGTYFHNNKNDKKNNLIENQYGNENL